MVSGIVVAALQHSKHSFFTCTSLAPHVFQVMPNPGCHISLLLTVWPDGLPLSFFSSSSCSFQRRRAAAGHCLPTSCRQSLRACCMSLRPLQGVFLTSWVYLQPESHITCYPWMWKCRCFHIGAYCTWAVVHNMCVATLVQVTAPALLSNPPQVTLLQQLYDCLACTIYGTRLVTRLQYAQRCDISRPMPCRWHSTAMYIYVKHADAPQ
jgi:hypothetical protein